MFSFSETSDYIYIMSNTYLFYIPTEQLPYLVWAQHMVDDTMIQFLMIAIQHIQTIKREYQARQIQIINNIMNTSYNIIGHTVAKWNNQI